MDTIPSPRDCLKTRLRNFLTAAFTNAVTSPRDALKSAIDFLEHPTAEISRARSQILLRRLDSKLNGIGALNIRGQRFWPPLHFRKQFIALLQQQRAKRVFPSFDNCRHGFLFLYMLIPAHSSHSSLEMIEGAIRLRHLNNLLQKMQEIYLL